MRGTAPVVDASVAIKWVPEEPFTDQASALFDDALARHQLPQAPPHLPGEVVNAIYRRTRRTSVTAIPPDEARLAVSHFLRLPIAVVAPPGLYEEAYAIAEAQRLASIYDGLYVALAKIVGADLWTADERLLNAVRTFAPWVRWIGEYRSA